MRGLQQHVLKSTEIRDGGVFHARARHPAAQTACSNADFCAARTNCHDTKTCAADGILTLLPISAFHSHHFLFFRRNRRPSRPAIIFSLQTHQSPLQHRCYGFCKHTTNEQRFTSRAVGRAEQNGRPPHTRPSAVAASPTDLGGGKHTHVSVRPTCYTSQA